MDFVTALPKSENGNDSALVVIDKFSKETIIIPTTKNITARSTAKILWSALLLHNWGIPKIIITDRDPKFLAMVWQEMWKLAGTKLLYTTAYHLQTDGQLEWMVQWLELALRVAINALHSPMNTTKRSPNELTKGFTPNNVTLAMSGNTPTLLDLPITRLEAHDAIAMAAISMKHYYDRHHKPTFFAVGDKVYLRLYRGYTINSPVERKVSQQFAGPFTVTERVGRSAYRLNVPEHWRIHPVISVDQLERADYDPFDRNKDDPTGAAITDRKPEKII
ncbi:transposon tf2-1 poly [Fusarium globosum]|uniref:Transposon tf2-1 poly n=1 Tax=Fusarium globosum TaxID=78864 RepID=A0A8H5XMT0_9HYPO|nr:transposon tf2-1 poly [Fusarium globosum]